MKINFWILAAITVLLCFTTYQWLHERATRKATQESLKLAVEGKLIINAKAPLASVHVDTAGVSHSIFNTTSLTNKQPVAVSKGLLDTIVKGLDNVKPDEVTNYELINARAEASDLKAQVDSLQKQLAFVYNDQFLNLRYKPANPLDPNDHGTFDFGYNIQLKSVSYTKGIILLGLPFGKQTSYTDVSSLDKRTKINGLEYLTFEQKKPALNVNIQAAANYSFFLQKARFGPAIQLDAGRFSIQGVAYYNNDPQPFKGRLTGKFNPEINARFSVF